VRSPRGLYPFVVVALVVGLLPMVVMAQPEAETGRIEPALLERLRIEGTANFFVKMAMEADLSAAYDIADWNERGKAVINALREVARVSQAPAIDYARRQGLDYTSFLTTNSVFVRGGNLDSAVTLAALPGVGYLRLERILEIPVQDSEPVPGLQSDETEGSASTATFDWGILDTKADQVWIQYGARGQGIVVGSIDTGVDYTHVALQPNYRCGAGPHTDCWLDPGTEDCDGVGGGPCETFPALGYHGTHTLATSVATDDPALNYIAGMAPSAQWIACLGCPSGPAGCPEFDTNACADWMLAPGGNPANRPQVVSNSWGGGGGDLWFLPAVNAWRAAGIFPAFAAGNGGPVCATAVSPGSYQESISTAAHDSNRLIAIFSSRGPSWYGHEPYTKPNISAPGVNIISAKPGNGWEAKSGTSTASPHTAGAVALVWSACPSYAGKVDQTFALLANTADSPLAGNCGSAPDGEGNYAYGYGYLNVLAAVERCSGMVSGTLQGQVLDTWGSPVQGAAVLAKPEPGGAGVQVTTDSSGAYGLELEPGTYVVTASKSGYLSQTVSDVIVVGGQATVQDFTLSQWGTLEGHVLDPSGYPVEGTSVYIDGGIEGAGVQATTDPSGFYTMQLLVGTYDVTAYKVGYSAVTAPGVVVLAGQTTVQDFTLTQVPPPEAAFGAQPTAGVAPLIVQFTDESTGENQQLAVGFWRRDHRRHTESGPRLRRARSV
jgi:hypothetical protein